MTMKTKGESVTARRASSSLSLSLFPLPTHPTPFSCGCVYVLSRLPDTHAVGFAFRFAFLLENV